MNLAQATDTIRAEKWPDTEKTEPHKHLSNRFSSGQLLEFCISNHDFLAHVAIIHKTAELVRSNGEKAELFHICDPYSGIMLFEWKTVITGYTGHGDLVDAWTLIV